MKLNVFRIEKAELASLESALVHAGMEPASDISSHGWIGTFYFSANPSSTPIPWVQEFRHYLGDGPFKNRNFFGALVMTRDNESFAITFGRAHFTVRPFCDYDFGIDIAKRIADDNDTRLTSGRRLFSRQNKDIRGYARDSPLSIPPGESVELLQSAVRGTYRASFGPSAKFGASFSFSAKVLAPDIGQTLSAVSDVRRQPANLKIPRTVVLTEESEIKNLDELLLDELERPVGVSELASTTFDLFGVDFVFGEATTYRIRCGNIKPEYRDQLTMRHVKQYIAVHKIPRKRLLSIKIDEFHEDKPDSSRPIREVVDFISDKERVLLSGGRWMRFNQDYLEFLDEAVRQIEVETPEQEFEVLHDVTEPRFNAHLARRGYTTADKDYKVLQTPRATPIEAWDLQRGDTVYAVKFGTPQKLNYVVDQATIVLEILKNQANVKQIPTFRRYCLWMAYRGAKPLPSLADTRSVILKQKVETWARLCRELGITPVLKLSHKTKPGVDEETPGALNLPG